MGSNPTLSAILQKPFRTFAAQHFKNILDGNEVNFHAVVPYLEVLANAPTNRSANHHLHGITAQQAATHPDIVASLIEQIVNCELKV